MSDLSGKTILVTGSNTGIGRAAAEAFAVRGAHVVLANRSEAKTQPVLDAIRAKGGSAEFVPLDLSDLAATRQAADRLGEMPRIDVLVNNAGLAGLGGISTQGFELTFAVNHLGPFLLTERLLPKLREATAARVVFVASRSHFQARGGIDFGALRQPTRAAGLKEYGVSKLCNVLYARELARRLAGTGVTTYSLHPGVVATDIWRDFPQPIRGLIKLFMLDDAEGARTTVHCAASQEAGSESGLYYDRCKPRRPSRKAHDDALGDELVRRSREFAAAYLD